MISCGKQVTEMDEKVFDQIMSIRDSGIVNMLLTNEVQRIAYEKLLRACLLHRRTQAKILELYHDRGM